MTTLDVNNLRVAYGPVAAVDGISFVVPRGSCTSVLGVNGAGKSSLTAAIVGWVTPRSGTVSVDGTDLTGWPAHKTVAAGVALVPERRQLFSPLTVEQNLVLGGYRLNRSKRSESVERVLSLFPDLTAHLHKRAGDLSGGQQQMLAIARALMSDPKVLILDEPSLGLAPLVVEALSRTLANVLSAGAAMLIVEQNSRLALELSSEVLVLAQGRVAAQGPSQELLSDNAELLEMFLG